MNIKDKITYIKREYIKRLLTGNKGKVVEEENRLICYIEYPTILLADKINKSEVNVEFFCHGIILKNLAIKYGLDKPIYYVFSKINRNNDNIRIIANNAIVVLDRLNLYGNLSILSNSNVIISNSDLNVNSNFNISTRNLTLYNMNIYDNNLMEKKRQPSFINLLAIENIKLKNSSIAKFKNLNIYASKLNLKNSFISGDDIKLNVESLAYDPLSIFEYQNQIGTNKLIKKK